MQTIRLIVCCALLLPVLHVAADEVEKLVFLIVKDDEVIASNTRLGRFDRLDLRAKEKILDYKAANAVAVVVTNQRYVAYGVFTGNWGSVSREAGEKFISMDVADYSALVVTSERYLNYYGRTGAWQETDH